MSYVPIEELLPQAGGSIYRLIRMASDRALELSEGKPMLIKNPTSDKVTTIAMIEIAQGKVEIKGLVHLKDEKGAKEKKKETKQQEAKEEVNV